MPTNINAAWAAYRRTRSGDDRNTLIEHYLPLVRYQAERIHVKLPDEVELDDLTSAGVFGLMDAIAAFDPNRGVKFKTYAALRIRGAILDEIRAVDWVPRLTRKRSALVSHAKARLRMDLGREPTDNELRRRLGVTRAMFARIQRDSEAVGVVSLSRKWFETDSNKDVREIDIVQDRQAPAPDARLQREDLKDFLTRVLSRAERLLFCLYYYEELTMKEIGHTIGLSESRVSQMHTSIIARLKARLVEQGTPMKARLEQLGLV